MKNWVFGVLIGLFFLLLGGCKYSWDRPSHQFVEQHRVTHNCSIKYFSYADLNQDQIDELIVTESCQYETHPLFIQNQEGNYHSQLNLPHPLNSFNTVHNPYDDTVMFFYSFNDGLKCYLHGVKYQWGKRLTREEFNYEPVERTDELKGNPGYKWYGSITPMYIRDLDKDGKPELICLAADGFASNPRGIYVYDLAAGKLKWKFDTAACIASLLLDDFDRDGTIDLIASTSALKNTSKEVNGTTDFSPVIFVLSGQGELLYLEKCFDGFGNVVLKSEDINNDGKDDIIRIDKTWGSNKGPNSISIIESDGRRFIQKRKHTFMVSIAQNTDVFIERLDESGDRYIITNSSLGDFWVLDKNLNLVETDLQVSVRRIDAVQDIRRNNKKVILFYGGDDEYFALDHKFQIIARLKNPFPRADYSVTRIVENGALEQKRIALVSPNEIRYLGLRHLPWHLTLWSVIQALIPYLLLLLVTVNIVLLYVFALKKKREALMFGQLPVGVMILSKKRIKVINKEMLKLLCGDEKPPRITHQWLAEHEPHLDTELKTFISSDTYASRATVTLSANPSIVNRLTLFRIPQLQFRVIVMISKPESDERSQDKVQWAEVSRRLSHHVRRHISSILLALDILENNPDPEEQIARRETIKSEIDKIKRFTQAFQRFTEMQDYQLRKVDIIPYLEKSMSRFRIPENINLIRDWSLVSQHALIEPIRFEEVITNLVANAIESMPEGGTLRVSASATDAGDCLLEIEDNGCGIPAKYLEDIFKPFFTTKQNGTGIGLAEVKKLLSSMQAEIELISEENVAPPYLSC